MTINNRTLTSTPRFTSRNVEQIDAAANQHGWTVSPFGALYRRYDRAGVRLSVRFAASGVVASSEIVDRDGRTWGHTYSGKHATPNKKGAVLEALAGQHPRTTTTEGSVK
jgi:hypothetical protein